jgi:hypothetical protein
MELGADLDGSFLTKEALQLASLMQEITADPPKYGVTEDEAALQTGEDIVNPPEGSFHIAIKDVWNSCDKIDRTVAMGILRYGMFCLPMARTILGELPLAVRKVH